jgi:hypothetical protein
MPNSSCAVTKTKSWLASNCRLNSQGLEQATQRATKIGALAIKQKVILVAVILWQYISAFDR